MWGLHRVLQRGGHVTGLDGSLLHGRLDVGRQTVDRRVLREEPGVLDGDVDRSPSLRVFYGDVDVQ